MYPYMVPLLVLAAVEFDRAVRAEQERVAHHPGCSNQNVVHPQGKYDGVEECGCQSPVEPS